MKRPDLDAIEARAKAATPGPWRWTHDHPTDVGAHLYGSPGTQDDPYPRVLDDGSAGGEYCQTIETGSDDARFIAHSRQDISDLVAYVRHLEAKLGAIQYYSKKLGGNVLCPGDPGYGLLDLIWKASDPESEEK